MKIGVLGVQGAVTEHHRALERTLKQLDKDGKVLLIREPDKIGYLDGLIIPGGESSTISRLIESGLRDQIIKHKDSLQIMGTCAGSILLASEGDDAVYRSDTELLGLMDIRVSRNAFGRQRYSFECELDIKGIADDFPAVFIRAPELSDCRGGCEALSTIDGKIVAAEQDNLLTFAFHPELTEDLRVHEYFIKKIIS